MEQKLQERFEKIRREYKKGKRKLEKLQRKSRAKAHVQQKLREQAGLEEDLTHSRQEEASDNTAESRNSSFDLNSLPSAQQICEIDGDNSDARDAHSELSGVDLDIEVENNKPVHNLEEKEDQLKESLVTKASNEIKRNERDSVSPVLGESHHKITSSGRLSLSKYKKKHLTNKINSSPSSPTIVSALPNQRTDKACSLKYEKSPDLGSENNDNETVNSGEIRIGTQSSEIESDAIIFERSKPNMKSVAKKGITIVDDKQSKVIDKTDAIAFDGNIPLRESEKGTGILDGESTNKIDAAKHSPLENIDKTNKLNTLYSDSNSTSQDSIYDSPLVSDEGLNNATLAKSLPKQKRRSLSGVRRLSPRVSSSVSYVVPKFNGLSNSVPKRRSISKTQEHIIVSSMFQCLIDDVKRDNKLCDFELSVDYEKFIKPHTYQKQRHNSILTSSEEKENVPGNEIVAINFSDIKSGSLESQTKNCQSNCVKDSPVNAIVTLHEKAPNNSALEHVSKECQNNNICTLDKSTEVELQQPGPKDTVANNIMQNVMSTPKNKETSSQDICSSPPLFESPTNCLNSVNVGIANPQDCPNAPRDPDVANPATSDGLKEKVTFNFKEEPDTCPQESRSENNTAGVFLEQIATFEIPSGEMVLSLAAADNGLTNKPEVYIACLCTQSLKFYHCQESSWTCTLNYPLQPEIHMKKNSGGRVHAVWLGDSFGVVLQQPKTNLTNLHLFMYRNGSVEHSVIDGISGKSVNVKCLSNGSILSSYFIAPSSCVTKYTHTDNIQDQNSSQAWRKFSLEKVCGQVTCLVLVHNLDSALLGLTLSRKLHIWNHIEGVVLCSIDLVDVCSKDVFCPSAFIEQGYLFLPVFGKKKGQDVGSIVVVNPLLATSETLIPFQNADYSWTGCVWAALLDDKVLCTRETNGRLSLWDLYDGHLVASLDQVLTNCFTATRSLLVYVCNNSLHVYNLRNMT